MGIPTKEWDGLPYPGFMFYQTSSQEVIQMNSITDESQQVFSHNKHNYNILRVGYTTLDASEESGIDENWCLLDNQSTFKAFIKDEYLPKIRDAPDGQYLHAHCNSGVPHTYNIGDLPRHSNPILYNPKGIDNILSIGLIQKHYLVTYSSQYRNEFVVHFTQQLTFKMTKGGLF